MAVLKVGSHLINASAYDFHNGTASLAEIEEAANQAELLNEKKTRHLFRVFGTSLTNVMHSSPLRFPFNSGARREVECLQ